MALDGITVRETGVKEALAIFRALPLKVKEKELRKGHRRAGRILVNAERDGWRRVAQNRSGATEAGIGSISIKKTRRNELGAIAVGPVTRRDPKRSAYKALWFEYGTTKMAARPFVRPAINQSKGEMKKIVGNMLALSIQATLRRYRKKGLA